MNYKLFMLVFSFGFLSTAEALRYYSKNKAEQNIGRGISAEQSLKWLKNGNIRFQKGYVRNDGQSFSDIKKLKYIQEPHAAILSCSDSRVPPEIIFDQKLGEIFTVRTLGLSLDNNVIGSIEYSVHQLGVNLVLVMGNTKSNAMELALKTLKGQEARTESINLMLKDMHPRLQEFVKKEPSVDFKAEAWANTKQVAWDLLARSKLLKEKYEAGKIKLQPALYHLDSGKVEFSDEIIEFSK